MYTPKYSIELVNSAGLLLADLTGRAKKRRLVLSRNEPDQISWSLDFDDFERYCRRTNQDPRNLLINNSTEVRVKRLGTYLSGGQLNYYTPNLSNNTKTIEIRAMGFLNLFKDRYTDSERIFTATQATDIGWTLISESQAKTNGNFGITRGTVATVGVHDRTYRRSEVKQALQNLTNVETAPFDMEITYDKVFNTYAQIGSDRPDIVFEYPGNIREVSVPNDGSRLANSIQVLGGGIGDQALVQVLSEDVSSQLNYRLRERILTLSDVLEEPTLTDHGNSELAAWAFPFELPNVTIDGNLIPITDFNVGDRITVRIRGYQLLEHINSTYRIERIELNVDDEDDENIKVSLAQV